MLAGEEREYRVLVAAEGTHVQAALAAVVNRLRTLPEALARKYFTVKHRCFGFRVLSRAACGVHWLLRIPHRGFPYALFKLLKGDLSVASSTPSCMLDEFGAAYLSKYPPQDCAYETGSEALAVLAFVAESADVDIASIEAKHAAIRRLALRKGLQTWVPNFENLCAEFSCRQVASARVAGMGFDAGQKKDGKGDAQQPQQKKKASATSGGGGGPFRAFLHVKYQGRRMTPDAWREASAMYKLLSQEEVAFFKDLGQRGLVAWRQGFKAFGSNARPSEQTPPAAGTMTSTGAIVLQDALRHDVELVPSRSHDLREELRQVASEYRSSAKKKRQEERDMQIALQAAEQEVLIASQDACVFPEVRASDTFLRGHESPEMRHLRWFPPCAEMAQAWPGSFFLLTA